MKNVRLAIALVLGLSLTLAVRFLVYVGQAAPDNPVLAPPRNSHTASLTTTISITYDEPISAATVTSHTFAVHAMQTGLLTQTYGVNGGTISLNPVDPFKPGELVEVSATTATLNLSGSGPISPTVWQFQTKVGGGSGLFADSNQSLGNSDSYAVALGDLDRDSDLDAFVVYWSGQANRVWVNDGLGNFTDSAQSLGNLWSTSVALGDVDRDGDLDALVGNYDHPNQIWLNDGLGNFSDSGQDLGDNSWNFAVAFGDLDGDSDLDAFIGVDGDPKQVWLNDGSGSFSDSGQRLYSSYSRAIALGDLDRDGDLDAFVGNNGHRPNRVWLNNGDGIFTDSQQELGGGDSGDTLAVALGDVDGDGDLDAFVGNNGEPNEIWLNDGLANFTDSGQSLGNSGTWAIALGDIDGDGNLDAFEGNNYNQINRVWINDGTGTFDIYRNLDSLSSTAVALGDMDGDGDLDAFVGNRSGQANKVWLNRNQANLLLDKMVWPAETFVPGEALTYTVTYTNLGPQLAQSVLITDVLPISLTNVNFQSSWLITPTGSLSYTWLIGNLGVGQNGMIIITGHLSSPLAAGTFTNTAVITASSVDLDDSNNHASVELTVSQLTPVNKIYLPIILK